jgi:cytochrome P450
MTLLSESAEAVRSRVNDTRDHVRSAVYWSVVHGLSRTVARSAARRGDLQGRLIVGASGGGAVWDVIEDIRADGPVARGRLAFLTADHAVARDVLSSAAFRTINVIKSYGRFAPLVARIERDAIHPIRPPSLLVVEPPEHTRYRKLVSRVFTARAVESLRLRTEQIAADLLDNLAGQDTIDLVAAYCSQLPVMVIAEILGVPPEHRPRVLQMGSAAAPSLDFGLSWSQFRSVDSALLAFDEWLTEHLDRLRRKPSQDLFSQLIEASDGEGKLTELELKATAGLVLVAGFETTVNLLGNGIALLKHNPEQLDRLRREPDLWGNAVDEVLRIDPPVLMTGRVCYEPTTVGGVDLPAKAGVITILAGANRDPKVFDGPAHFDVARPNARDHLSFSAGRHFCLGAQLARMEGEVGLRALFERYPDLTLLPGAQRRPTRILRGWATLPARLAKPS